MLAKAFARKSAIHSDFLRDIAGAVSVATGRAINPKTAIQVATIFACARVIGNGIAQVPLKIMRASKDGKTRLPERDHPLYDVLATKPNDWQTSFEYREMVGWHVSLAGYHCSYINRSTRGEILELVPFEPSQVRPKCDDTTRELTYDITGKDGSFRTFKANEIWHVRGPSWNGWEGLEAVKIAREAIGLAKATEEAVARIHQNGIRASGAYSVEGNLSQKQYEDLADWIAKNNAGVQNSGKPMILDRSAKWLNTQMSSVDAQSYENRRMQVEEMCRFMLVNPIMIYAESKNTTYASAEQMFLSHVVHTLAPWYQRLEQSIDANLLTEKERAAGLYSCFIEEGLLRGSLKDTKDYLLGLVNGGLMTPNEGRAKLDLNPDANPESDKLRIPTNIVGAEPKNNEGAVNGI